MNIDIYLEETVQSLEASFSRINSSIEQPKFIQHPTYSCFRYERHTDSVACFLKSIKIVSSLNAALCLLRHGYIQEIGILSRVIHDLINDIFFILEPRTTDESKKDLYRFLDEFFQEEFDDPNNPIFSAQKRDIVPRRKIHASFARLSTPELNPSEAQELTNTIHKTFSGYVHGAYPHIMELYGGGPPSFHMSGMLNTPRVEEGRHQISDYLYRTLMISIMIAKKLQPSEVAHLKKLLEEFETTMKYKPTSSAGEMMDEYKRKKT